MSTPTPSAKRQRVSTTASRPSTPTTNQATSASGGGKRKQRKIIKNPQAALIRQLFAPVAQEEAFERGVLLRERKEQEEQRRKEAMVDGPWKCGPDPKYKPFYDLHFDAFASLSVEDVNKLLTAHPHPILATCWAVKGPITAPELAFIGDSTVVAVQEVMRKSGFGVIPEAQARLAVVPIPGSQWAIVECRGKRCEDGVLSLGFVYNAELKQVVIFRRVERKASQLERVIQIKDALDADKAEARRSLENGYYIFKGGVTVLGDGWRIQVKGSSDDGPRLSKELYFRIQLETLEQASTLTDDLGKLRIGEKRYIVSSSPLCTGCRSRDHSLRACELGKLLQLDNDAFAPVKGKGKGKEKESATTMTTTTTKEIVAEEASPSIEHSSDDGSSSDEDMEDAEDAEDA